MTFMRKFDTLLQKSNDNMCKIDSDNGINISTLDQNFKLLSVKKVLTGSFSFLDYWFDINKNDNIYGIINNKSGSLIYYNIKNNYIISNKIINYNPQCEFIKFVYIKNTDDCIHIIYYLMDINDTVTGSLIHHYKKNNKWITNTIDNISYNILTNFVVTYDDDDLPTIFYYNLKNGFEELYTSTFSITSQSWSKPIQITNSKKSKIYLSVIKDSNNRYHILFSENNFSKYLCTYINGYIHDSSFITDITKVIGSTIACMFPNVIEINNKIYANWIEYHNLYISMSDDYGITWSRSTLVNDSYRLPFICCNYHSNKEKSHSFNYFTLYMYENSNKLIGIDKIKQ